MSAIKSSANKDLVYNYKIWSCSNCEDFKYTCNTKHILLSSPGPINAKHPVRQWVKSMGYKTHQWHITNMCKSRVRQICATKPGCTFLHNHRNPSIPALNIFNYGTSIEFQRFSIQLPPFFSLQCLNYYSEISPFVLDYPVKKMNHQHVKTFQNFRWFNMTTPHSPKLLRI